MDDNIKEFQVYGIKGYTVMSNYHMQDKNLSLKAKGLLSLMLSLPKDWDYSINGLVTLSKDGRDSVKNALSELKEAQYLSIEEFRDSKGHFRYKYSVYYLPYPKWLNISKITEDGFTTSVKPLTENHQEQNNKYKKDKYDKWSIMNDEQINHNILTNKLIEKNYISDKDASSFLFDDFFNQLINDEHSYKELLIMTNYIVSKLEENDFKDENHKDIKNKYGYFKNALISNIEKLKGMQDDLYPDDISSFNESSELEDEEDLYI